MSIALSLLLCTSCTELDVSTEKFQSNPVIQQTTVNVATETVSSNEQNLVSDTLPLLALPYQVDVTYQQLLDYNSNSYHLPQWVEEDLVWNQQESYPSTGIQFREIPTHQIIGRVPVDNFELILVHYYGEVELDDGFFVTSFYMLRSYSFDLQLKLGNYIIAEGFLFNNAGLEQEFTSSTIINEALEIICTKQMKTLDRESLLAIEEIEEKTEQYNVWTEDGSIRLEEHFY